MSRGDRDDWSGGPYGGLGEAIGAFLWAVLFWAYVQASQGIIVYGFSHLAKITPVFEFAGTLVTAIPLLLGWLILFQALRFAIVPSLRGDRGAEPVVSYLPSAVGFLLLSIVLRVIAHGINRIAANPQSSGF